MEQAWMRRQQAALADAQARRLVPPPRRQAFLLEPDRKKEDADGGTERT